VTLDNDAPPPADNGVEALLNVLGLAADGVMHPQFEAVLAMGMAAFGAPGLVADPDGGPPQMVRTSASLRTSSHSIAA
jgi:hypothetical protein